MKSVSFYCIIITVFLSACQPQQQAINNSAPTPPANLAVSTAQPPAHFELRDFILDEQRGTYAIDYKGRGTLVAKEPSMNKGAYIVWLSASREHQGGERWKTIVIVKDGIGTVSTFDFQPFNSKDPKVKYVDWTVLGYAELKEGVMVGQNAVDTKKQ